MYLVAALDRLDGAIRPVLGLHETVCSGAADGYGRMTGRPALALLHMGPGLANALSGAPLAGSVIRGTRAGELCSHSPRRVLE